jgi:hypothetical protein
MSELARSTGTPSDGGGPVDAPLFNSTTGITLSSAAPTVPGSYTWNAAWYGNQNDAAGATFGARWTPDPNNFEHGQEIVSTNAFTVTASAAPIIGVSPTTVPFGTVNLGVSANLTVTVSNTGTAPLNVTGIALGAGTSTEFTWAPLAPFTVAAGASTPLVITFTPTSVGAKTGSIVISSNDTVTPTVTVNVSGTGAIPPVPVIALNPNPLNFGTLNIGASSNMTTQIQNNGAADLVVNSIALCAGTITEFSFVQIAPVTIIAGTSASLSVAYAPTNIGTDTGCIAIGSNDPVNSTINLNLTGTGAQGPTPGITLAQNPLNFGTMAIGTSLTLVDQIQSTGTAPLNVTGIALCAGTTEFSFTPITLPVSIPVGNNVPFNITYTPGTVGPVTGCINITSNAPVATQNLTGTGTPAPAPVLGVLPTTLTFGTQQVGTTSSTQLVTISNTGTAPMTGVSVSSSNAEWTIVGSPTPTIAAGGNTTFTVAFTPTSVGAASATITVATTNSGSTTVTVSGTGTAVPSPTITLVPNPLAFGTVTNGATSTLTSQIQNTGTTALVVSSISGCGLTTQFSFTPLTLPSTIPVGGKTDLSVSYTPTTVGAVTDCITIVSNDQTTPSATLNLTGTGATVPTPVIGISPNPLTFGTVTIGNASTLTATIQNTGAANLVVNNIALCTGTTAEFSFVQIAPVTIIPGESTSLSMTYTPTNVGAATGCLEILSNDPVTTKATLNLTGTGAEQPPPTEVEYKIKQFIASPEVEITKQCKGKEKDANKDENKDDGQDIVKFKLLVSNKSMVNGSVPVSLVGMQNRVQVYKETITVSVDPGKVSMFRFPSFTPTEAGDILWTVTIEDNVKDIKHAKAVTHVIKQSCNQRQDHDQNHDHDHDHDQR